MKDILQSFLLILGPLCVGICLGHWLLPTGFFLSTWPILCVFTFCVGLELPTNSIKLGDGRMILRIIALPILIVVGSWAGAALVALITSMLTIYQSLLVASGLGYYSLSSVLIATKQGPEIASIALLANVFRELFTLVGAVMLTRWFGKQAPTAFGAACAMDSCLPAIRAAAGPEAVYPALFSGAVLTFLVPVLVTTLLKI